MQPRRLPIALLWGLGACAVTQPTPDPPPAPEKVAAQPAPEAADPTHRRAVVAFAGSRLGEVDPCG